MLPPSALKYHLDITAALCAFLMPVLACDRVSTVHPRTERASTSPGADMVDPRSTRAVGSAP